jgi:hypothetical protein
VWYIIIFSLLSCLEVDRMSAEVLSNSKFFSLKVRHSHHTLPHYGMVLTSTPPITLPTTRTCALLSTRAPKTRATIKQPNFQLGTKRGCSLFQRFQVLLASRPLAPSRPERSQPSPSQARRTLRSGLRV